MGSKRFKLVVFSLLSSVKLAFVGTLILSEVYAVLNSFSGKAINRAYYNIPDLKRVHIALLFFLIAQIASDLMNRSPAQNYLRGWAVIVIAAVVIAFMTRMFNNTHHLLAAFLMAEIVRLTLFGQVELEMVDASELASNHAIFKFRIAPITNNILLLICYYIYDRRHRSLVILMFGLYGLMSIALDARSNGLYFLLAALVMFCRWKFIGIITRKPFLIISVLVIVFQSLYMIYIHAALSGEFGGEHNREQLYRLENPYNPFSLISTGRSEVFIAIAAIKDKPLFGHGSWAEDKGNRYRSMMWNDYSLDRMRAQAAMTREIPSHSILFGAWLYAGVIGFLAMFYIFFLTIKRAFYLIRSQLSFELPYFPIIVLFTVQLLWTFFFSPLSHIRSDVAMMVAFIITLHQAVRNEEEEAEEEEEEDDNETAVSGSLA